MHYHNTNTRNQLCLELYIFAHMQCCTRINLHIKRLYTLWWSYTQNLTWLKSSIAFATLALLLFLSLFLFLFPYSFDSFYTREFNGYFLSKLTDYNYKEDDKKNKKREKIYIHITHIPRGVLFREKTLATAFKSERLLYPQFSTPSTVVFFNSYFSISKSLRGW